MACSRLARVRLVILPFLAEHLDLLVVFVVAIAGVFHFGQVVAQADVVVAATRYFEWLRAVECRDVAGRRGVVVS